MSTQTHFDLTGLSHAIQSGDCRYQLALYADDAEVLIVDAARPAALAGVLRGKSAIQGWLDTMSSRAVQFQVRDAVASPGQVRYTEECWYRDGSQLRLECTAEVRRGQISQAAVTVVHPPEAAAGPGAQHDSGLVAGDRGRVARSDAQPPSAPARWRSPSLPGNFLG
jgi:hypothetical protein